MTISYEKALTILLKRIEKSKKTEILAIEKTRGRRLAEDIYATFDQPPFSRSPLDGYALRSQDIAGASADSPVKLNVIDQVTAGHCTDKTVTSGTAVRIMTGAPVPDGADCVIGQEDTDQREDRVSVYCSLKSHQNICPKGEDFNKGDLLLEKGTLINSSSIGVLASAGIARVKVGARPKVLLMSTGDELLLPGDAMRNGGIYDSNLFLIRSELESWGAEIVLARQVNDEPENAAALCEEYAGKVDLIVSTGGVSVGKKDIMHDVFRMLDVERLFWRVSVKPGMPVMAGVYNNTPLLALSGNPFGAFVTSQLFIPPVLCRLSGDSCLGLEWREAILQNEYKKKSPVRRFLRSKFMDGKVTIIDKMNGNGTLSSLCRCNCLIDIPGGNEGMMPGDKVSVLMIKE